MIVVYGATGKTGRLICRELVERGLEFSVAGRDGPRVAALAAELDDRPHHIAPVHDSDLLGKAFAGAAVIINCAGPFLRIGEPVVKAALAAGCHYLDTTGEQAFARLTYERFESAARHAKLAVVSACAFEGAIGDWAASLAAQPFGGEVDEISIAYAVDRMHASLGTQLSAIDSLRAPSCIWEEGRWTPEAPGKDQRDFHFPAPFGCRPALSAPLPEVITVPRHVDARRVRTYFSLLGDTPVSRLATAAASFLAPAVPALAASPLGALARAFASGDLNDANRSETTFSVVAEASKQFKLSTVAVSGSDIYAISADVAVTCAKLLVEGSLPRPGALTTSELIDPKHALAQLSGRHELEVVQS